RPPARAAFYAAPALSVVRGRCEPDAPCLPRRTLRSPHQEHALLPPVNYLGKLPAIPRRLFENFHQAGPVDDLRHRQNSCLVLPLAAGYPDRGDVARHGAIARRWLLGLVRVVV